MLLVLIFSPVLLTMRLARKDCRSCFKLMQSLHIDLFGLEQSATQIECVSKRSRDAVGGVWESRNHVAKISFPQADLATLQQ